MESLLPRAAVSHKNLVTSVKLFPLPLVVFLLVPGSGSLLEHIGNHNLSLDSSGFAFPKNVRSCVI